MKEPNSAGERQNQSFHIKRKQQPTAILRRVGLATAHSGAGQRAQELTGTAAWSLTGTIVKVMGTLDP